MMVRESNRFCRLYWLTGWRVHLRRWRRAGAPRTVATLSDSDDRRPVSTKRSRAAVRTLGSFQGRHPKYSNCWYARWTAQPSATALLGTFDPGLIQRFAVCLPIHSDSDGQYSVTLSS